MDDPVGVIPHASYVVSPQLRSCAACTIRRIDRYLVCMSMRAGTAVEVACVVPCCGTQDDGFGG